MTNNYTNSRRSPFSILLGLLFLPLGILLTGSTCFFSGVLSIPTCNPASWLWPSTEARVISSTTKWNLSLRAGRVADWSQYTYTVNVHNYTKNGTIGRNSALQPGEIISVHYNTQNPDESVCNPGFDPVRTPMSATIGIGLLFGGVAYLLYGFGLLKKPTPKE